MCSESRSIFNIKGCMKGKLIIVGASEDKGENSSNVTGDDFLTNGILKRMVEESRLKKKSRIEIVTTASNEPDIGQEYVKAFRKLGAENCHVLSIHSREQAHDQEIVKKVRAADVMYFTGGNQLQLTHRLGGTPVFDAMLDKLQKEPFIYAGTSAGAAAVSNTMIVEGESDNAILKGEVKTTGGFGLIDNIVFDTHFIHRGRIGRLFQILVSNPDILGVGLEENTGLMISGNKMEAIGPGMTIVLDGKSIKKSNLLEIIEGAPISIDNLTLHVMSKTDVFDLKTRELTIKTAPECLK
jgi:cyanophycinase